MTTIPFFGLDRQYARLREEILDAADSVYRTGQVLDGDVTLEFEKAMAQRCHREFAVAVNSCTQGLVFALLATQESFKLNNVIIPTISFAATLNSVLMARHMPIYCDVDHHGLIDLQQLTYNPRTYNIDTLMYVNLFGNVVDYDKMQLVTDFFNSEKMTVIEDAAQSFGASYKGIPSGKLGDISVLSFDPTKNLPNYGSGGMILTDDFKLYNRVMELRDNGKHDGHIAFGTNSKMSESDCAQMLVKLKYFDQWQARRTEIARYYTDRLSNHIRVTEVSKDVVHAWHKYPLWMDHFQTDKFGTFARNVLANRLNNAGIQTKIHYTTPLNDLGCNPHSSFLNAQGDYPIGETHSRSELSIPIYPELTDAEVEYIANKIIESISS